MSLQPGDSKSWQIVDELVEVDYERYFNGGTSRLANATREYVCALREAAMDYGTKHPDLIVSDYMRTYHENVADEVSAI
jgi:hypothetical protein